MIIEIVSDELHVKMTSKDSLEDIDEISELKPLLNKDDLSIKLQTKDLNHPRLSNRRATELPSDLYLKEQLQCRSHPLTPPPSHVSPTEEEKRLMKQNKRRLSTPALKFSQSSHTATFASITETLNRLAIG